MLEHYLWVTVLVSLGLICADGFLYDQLNTRCPSLTTVHHSLSVSPDGRAHSFLLDADFLVEDIRINIAECQDDLALSYGGFNISYVDAADFTMQEIVLETDLQATVNTMKTTMDLSFQTIYTRNVTFTNEFPVQCSTFSVRGCSPSVICSSVYCKNGGTCIGNGNCACPIGFMGTTCETKVQDMEYDDFRFVTSLSDVLYTNIAAFNISGDVTVVYDNSTLSRRRTLGLIGSLLSFLGTHGSCHYLPSFMNNYVGNNNNLFGFHTSHNMFSCLHNLAVGFSHTVHAIFGHNHHHEATHYFYTTHGHSHYSNGVSLHYGNFHLHLHVHHVHSNGQAHHFSLSALFNPLPGVPYHISSSYSPHYGVCIYVNGGSLGCSSKPTVSPSHTGTPSPLCFGTCGAPNGGGHANLTLANFVAAGACVPTLAANALLGLLGLPMLNVLSNVHHGTTTASTTSALSTKQSPLTTPPTMPPVTATTMHSTASTSVTTTQSPAPLCYQCSGITTNGGCNTVLQCFHGEVCVVFQQGTGYTHRCMDKQLCDTEQKLSKNCWNCCTADRCNAQCVASTSSCTDTPKCQLLLGVGYDVCKDPVVSSTVCPQTCNKCITSG